MNDEDKYLFDLQGYLVLEDVLSADDVAAINGQLDSHRLWDGENKLGFDTVKRYNDFLINAGYLHMQERPMRSLVAHPPMIPYLSGVLGEDFRYDEGEVLFARKGAGSLILHGGGTPWEPELGYGFRDGRIWGGHVIVAFCLTDALDDQGGFAVVPGSHKANFPLPKDFALWKKTGPWLRRVPVKAGSAIIFTDSVTHGSWPWEADFERRVVFCRYTGGSSRHTAHTVQTDGSHFTDWSDVERRVLAGPYAWRFVTEDGRYKEIQRPSVVGAEGYTIDDHGYQIVRPATDDRA